jgi:hypothetical protein
MPSRTHLPGTATSLISSLRSVSWWHQNCCSGLRLSQERRGLGQDVNNVTNAKEKPVLDPESFQRLLAAAFMLQSQNDPCPPKPIGGGHPRTFAIPGIVQKRTPALRKPSLQRSRLKPLVQFANPRLWRTVETLAVATVFCMMIGVLLRRVSPLRGNPSRPVMAEVRTARSSTPLAAKVLGLSQERVATLSSRRSTDNGEAEVVAKDIVIRYHRPSADLRDNQAPKKLKSSLPTLRLRSENTTLQPGVRYTFGIDSAMLAADTVVRYDTGSAAFRVHDHKQP